MKNIKYFITGGSGQLASELQRQLANKEFIAVDVDKLDITKLCDVRELIGQIKPDVIINCAAYTNVDRCEEDSDTAFAVNAIGTRNLAVVAEKIKAKLIHISTDYVFSGTDKVQKCEYDLPNPQSVYGKTKLLGEEYAKQFCSKYFIVRTAWLYGIGGNNFVKTILNAAKSGKPLKVVNDQIGNPTNVKELAKILLKLSETEQYGLYHATNNGECSWFDFACKFLDLSGLEYKIEPCTTAEFPRPAKRPAYSSLDNMMLRLTVGDDMRNWEDAIKDFMKEYKL